MKQQEQKHPQHHSDRIIVDTLLESEANDYNIAELARLKVRYRGFPGARDIQNDLDAVLQKWQLTEETLYEKTRKIHSQGHIYRGKKVDQEDWI